MTKGIRQEILYRFLSLTLIIMVLLTAVLVFQGQQLLVKEARNSMIESSQLRSQIIALRLQQEVNKLVYLSKTAAAKSLDGNEIISLLKNIVSDSENRLLVNALYAKTDGSILSMFNETGNIGKMPYFIKLLEGNLDYMISDPTATQTDKPPVIVILASIRDSQGIITGVMGSAIDLGKLTDSLTDAAIHESTYSWIIDKNGSAISYPSPESLTKLGFKDTSKPSFAGADIIGQDSFKAESGIFDFFDKSDNRSKIGAYSIIPGTDQWKLCTAMSNRVVFSPLYMMAGLLAAASILLAGLVTFQSNHFSHNISEPINKVAVSAERFENGLFEPVEEPNSPQELSHLVRSFNHMANSLGAKTEELKTAVSEKDKSIKTINRRIRDRSDRMSQANAGLFDASVRDNLTQLLTRDEMIKQLEQIKVDVDTGITENFSLLLMGLDEYGSYFESYGQQAGDLMIQKTAQMIFTAIRSTDIAARHLDDTFMIMLSGTNEVRTEVVIRKLTQSYKDHHGFQDISARQNDSSDSSVTILSEMDLSFSVVFYTKNSGHSVEKLIHQAENALEEMKTEHRKALIQGDSFRALSTENLSFTEPSDMTEDDSAYKSPAALS